jgi:hypothetical protein
LVVGDSVTGNVNINVQKPRGIWLLWQHEASYYADFGDSGSPVFYNVDGFTVDLIGIHWGNELNSDGSINHNRCFFSDVQYVNFGQDLGANLYYAIP